MLSKLRRSSQQGFTLVEIAIVLGIIGVVLGAIWVAASRVNANNKVQRGAQQYMQILSNYRTLYSQHGIDVADNTDITCVGVDGGFFPTNMVSGSCTSSTSTGVLNPWGGMVNVIADQTNSGIGIKYSGLNNAGCIGLASQVANAPDAIYEDVNNSSPQYLPPVAANTAWTVVTISGKCTSGNSNYVYVKYKAR